MSGNRDELPEPTDGPQGSPRSQQRRARDEIAEELGIDPSLVATRDTIDRGIERRLTDEGATAAEQQLRRETAADREFVQPADLRANVDRETFSGSATLTEEGRQRAQQRQAEQLRQEAASQSDRFGESDFRVDRSGEEIEVGPTESAVDRERREAAADQFEGQSQFINDVEPADVTLTDDSAELADSIIDRAEARAERQARQQAQQQRQQARQDFAQSIESGSAFGDLPDGVDPGSLIGNVDPQDDIVAEDGSLTLAADVQGRINSRLESDALQQQRQDFAQALESGEAFEGGEAPDALGDVDPQTDIEIDDGQLTLADDTRTELIETQIREQAGGVPGLNTGGVLERAASQEEIYRAVEEQIENQTGTETRPGLIEDANLSVGSDGTISANRLLLNSRRFDDFRDVGAIPDDVLGDANLSVDATEQFNEQIRESIAEQVSDRNVVNVDPSDVDISSGDVSVATPESLTIESGEIGDSGLTSEGQDDFARRQLQDIQTTEGVSVDTPIGSQAFANVSADLAQAAEGGGSLSSATRIVAASDTVSNVGDLDDLPDARIIEGLEPEQAEERLGIDAGTVREAQQDIQQRRQQLNNNPGAVLQDISNNQDEFINDSTRIGVAGERGQRIRQAARTQLNELEESIAAGDGDVSAGDVDLTLTDDLSGIRSVNQAGQRAIAEQVDEQLPNFGAEEIDVGVSNGEITTSIEDSVRDRFIQNAQRVEEIQVRNEIADTTEGIDRREINVDDGTVSLSDEGLNQLRIDAVDGETGDGEIVNDLNAQTQGVDLDVGDVRLQQTAAGGVSVGLSEFGRTQLNTDRPSIDEMLSQSTAAGGFEGQGQVVEPAADPAENFGDAVPDSIEDTTRQLAQETGQVVDGAAGFVGDVFQPAGTAVENTLTGLQDITGGDVSAIEANARAANETVTNAAEGVTSGLLFPVRAAGSAPQLAVETTEFGIEAASDPVETAEKIPGAIGERVDQSITGLQQNPVQTSAELVGSFASSSAVFRAAQGTKAGPAVRATMQPGEELFKAAGRRGITGSRRVANIISNPNFGSEDRGQTSPLLGLEGRSESDSGGLLDDLEDDLNNVESTSPEVDEGQTSFRPEFDRESDIDAGDPIERRVEVRQRSVDDRSRDEAFRRSLQDEPTTPDIDVDVGSDLLAGGVGSTIDAIEPQVDADETVQSPEVTADTTTAGTVGADLGGVDSQFEQSIGETGQQRFFERTEGDVQGEQIDSVGVTPGFETGFDARPRDRTEPGFETDLRTGLETGTETGQEPRQETRTGIETETVTAPGIETGFESEPGFETTFEPGSEIDPPEPVPEAEDPDEEQAIGLQSTDDLFDSEILSGEEALEQSFGSDGGRDDRFSL